MKENAYSWNRIYKLVSVITVFLSILPLFSAAGGWLTGKKFIGVILLAAFMLVGYILRYVFSRPNAKQALDFTSEGIDIEKPSSRNCMLPIITEIVLAFIFIKAVKPSIIEYTIELKGYYPDKPVQPYVVFILALAAMIVGTVLAVYPFTHIVSLQNFILYLVIMLIELIFLPDDKILLICFWLWALLSLFLLNQTYIIKSILATKINYIKHSARIYNLVMVLIAILIMTVLFGLIAVIINGIYTIIMILIFYPFIYSVTSGNENTEQNVADLSNGVLENGLFKDAELNKSSLWLFALLFILMLVLIIFGRKLHIVDKIGKFLNNLFNSILAFLTNAAYFNRMQAPDEDEDVILYVDKEIKQDKDALREVNIMNKQRRSYKDFLRILNSFKNENEKMAFTYKVLVDNWRHAGIGVTESDTPLEILQIIKSKMQFDQIDEITEIFTQIRYAEETADEEAAKKSVHCMCRLIEKYYE